MTTTLEKAESALIHGDLSKLTPDERTSYYLRVCDSLGLNPLTKPFEYITLNGKLTLYARKDCTDQLRTVHAVSIVDLTESEREGVFIVTAKVRNGSGRTDMAKGAVPIQGLKGEALANAMMKAETKAKRRATLSLCGLGMLDETELDTIADAVKQPLPQPEPAKPALPAPKEIDHAAALRKCKSLPELSSYWSLIPTHKHKDFAAVKDEMKAKLSQPAPQDRGDAYEPEAFEDADAMAALLHRKGQNWGDAVTWLNSQVGSKYAPSVLFANVLPEHRNVIATSLATMPDVEPEGE